MNLSPRQRDLLMEAARRRLAFNYCNEPITRQWTGLGYMTTYKPVVDAGLMRFIHPYVPRCAGWLVLTEKGAAIVQTWIDNGLKLDSTGFELFMY